MTLTGHAGYLDCQGPLRGPVSPRQLPEVHFEGFGSFLFAGSSGDAHGPFVARDSEPTSGTLSLTQAAHGLFVIGLKAGPAYSLYLFDGGAGGITSLDFDTLSPLRGNGPSGPGLSRATLYLPDGAFPMQPVPELGSVALMLGGLLGVAAFVRRRRREP